MPAMVSAAVTFGWYAILVTLISIAAAVATEYAVQRFRGVEVTVHDGSAVLTGLLLAMCLPPNVPLYMAAVGSVFAVGIAKHAFGGLGYNIWNPALSGRAFLLAAYSGAIVMSKWPILNQFVTGNIRGVDAISKATPLAVLQSEPLQLLQHYSLGDLFIGRIPGCIGETSGLALLIGAAYLIFKKYINWRLPLAYILTVMVLSVVLPAPDGHGGFHTLWGGGIWSEPSFLFARAIAQAFSGGLILGAFYMATDMVTSPLTSKGQAIYGICCGILVAVIRLYGGYPEGVCYSILIMNTAVWIIDRFTVPRFFGEVKDAQKAA
jgi:electron transport complex protein RnfD